MTDIWPQTVISRVAGLRESLRTDIAQFVAERQLPDAFHQVIDDYYLPLALWLEQRRADGETLVIGLCGGQGSGKSTLTEFLQLVWAQLGLRSAGFSIDDIYLTRAERRQLARQVHPLLQTRGVPGTHDVQLGLDTIAAVSGRAPGMTVAIPKFDKSIDDRALESEWPSVETPLDMLLFEGWCVGATPWEDAADPINRLEREEDPDGSWRNYINRQLAGDYRSLFAQVDILLMLKVPDMECVLEWRRLQEEKLRARKGGGMRDDEVERFVQHYERVTRNLLQEMPARADCVLKLGRDHGIAGLRLRGAD